MLVARVSQKTEGVRKSTTLIGSSVVLATVVGLGLFLRDHAAVADEFGGLAKSCLTCHQVFLFDGARTAQTELQP